MYPILVTFTPMENNHTIFKFKEGSKLAQFLLPYGVSTSGSTVKQVMHKLKNVIKAEKLYDNLNQSIILCSKALEHALNYSALHVSELRKVIIEQMESIPNQVLHTFLVRALDEQLKIYDLNKDIIQKHKNKKFHVKPTTISINIKNSGKTISINSVYLLI